MKKEKRRQFTRIAVIACIFLLEKAYNCDSAACKASKPTLATVSACPQNPKELQTAIEMKDCGSLAKLQNCSKPEDFVYHCLVSTTKDKLYEVCAPAIYSPGYCIGYDSFSQNIQILYQDRCTASSCSETFFSADIFNYSTCQQLLRSMEKTAMSSPHTLAIGNEGTSLVCNPGNDLGTIIGFFFCPFFLFFGIIIGILWEQKLKNKCLNSRNSAVVRYRQNVQNQDQEQSHNLLSQPDDRLCHCIKNRECCESSEKGLWSQAQGHSNEEVFGYTGNLGFDRKTFDAALKDFDLEEYKETFLGDGINCIQIFLKQKDEKLKNLGLNENQILKCRLAMPAIEDKYLKQHCQRHCKNRKKYHTS